MSISMPNCYVLGRVEKAVNGVAECNIISIGYQRSFNFEKAANEQPYDIYGMVNYYPGEEPNSYEPNKPYLFDYMGTVTYKEEHIFATDKEQYCVNCEGREFILSLQQYEIVKGAIAAKVHIPYKKNGEEFSWNIPVILQEDVNVTPIKSFASSALFELAKRIFYDKDLTHRQVWRQVMLALVEQKKNKDK